MRKIIQTDQAPAPVGPYNQGVVASGAMLFVAGQIPLDAATGELVGTTVAEQTEKVFGKFGGGGESSGFGSLAGG